MRTLIILFITSLFFSCMDAGSKQTASGEELYQCIPCGYDCDESTYPSPGTCPHCNMDLVKKSSINFKTLEPKAICSYIVEHPSTVLLDVRTREEFEGKTDPDFGTLKNAINIPIQELKEKMATIDSLKNRDIVVYCSHSHRSPQASYMLSQNGFKNITNLAGGMSVVLDNTCKIAR